MPLERSYPPGKLESALMDLWPVARKRLWQPRYWWRHLQLRRHYHLTPLKLHQLRVIVPQGLVPDCDACEEVCCAGPQRVVSLRFVDIAAFVDRGLEKHISMAKPGYSLAQLDHNPSLHNYVSTTFWRGFPVVTQDQTGTCTLLGTNLQCQAHPSWPLSCARYPYSLNYEAGVIFYAKSCRSTQTLAASESSLRVRALVMATLAAYNERIRDIILLQTARAEMEQLGLTKFLDWRAFGERLPQNNLLY